jgi:3-oxoacyl-[acyl-carrier protein] reductase
MQTNGKIALVTGGTRGIGLGIARELAGIGFNLALNGVRGEEKVTAVLEELRQMGVKVIYCQGDIGKTGDRSAILEKIHAEFGALHLLVNNAGVAPRERNDILLASEDSYDWVMNINLKGPYFLTQAAAKWMVAQKEREPSFQGIIVNITSISSTVASVNRGDYCLSKAGLSMMTQLYATRLAEHGIPVYEVRPGIIATDMTSGVKEKYDKLIGEGLTLQARWGTPEDVGKAVTGLAQGYFPYSTGQVIMVDGGMLVDRL